MSPGTSPFRFPVSDLIADPSRRRAVTVDTAVDWSVGGSTVGPGLTADLTVEGGGGGVVVRGSVVTDVRSTCHRCLAEWSEELTIDVMEVLGVEEDPDGYPLDGDVADLEDPVRDAVLLEIPFAPTCRADCLGLCSVCGGDLNTGSCAGHEQEVDSPFAVLRELLEPQ